MFTTEELEFLKNETDQNKINEFLEDIYFNRIIKTEKQTKLI